MIHKSYSSMWKLLKWCAKDDIQMIYNKTKVIKMIGESCSNDMPKIFKWYTKDIPMICKCYSNNTYHLFKWYAKDILSRAYVQKLYVNYI